MVQAKKTAAYRVIAGPGGKRVFRFYCDISGELCCVTKSIRADAEDEALEIAWALHRATTDNNDSSLSC